MIEQLPMQWRTCVLCGDTHPIRQGGDMCKKCQRVAKQSVRREEREWLGHFVIHPTGTRQVVGLAPQPDHVWVCDDEQTTYDCSTADLVRRDHQDVHQETLW